MVTTAQKGRLFTLALSAETAADLMSPQGVSLRDDAGVKDAMALLAGKDLGAVPVIDSAGRPIGVLTQGDMLVHQRERQTLPAGRAEADDPALARDLMTPAVFSVTPDTPAARVVEQLLALNVDQLFVVDSTEALIGIIRARDILRHLEVERERGQDL